MQVAVYDHTMYVCSYTVIWIHMKPFLNSMWSVPIFAEFNPHTVVDELKKQLNILKKTQL